MKDKRELSRAEIARQRRAKRAADELTQTGKRAIKPMVKPVIKQTTKPVPKLTFAQVEEKKKRRFNIAFGFSDAHLRKPKIAGRSSGNPDKGWRIFSLALSIVFVIAVYFALVHPYFNIPSVTVLGNGRLSREEISEATGALGQSIFTVQPEEVEARLRLTYPELSVVRVGVYLPNHVYVTVEERQPVILWQQNGAYAWIDAEGIAFLPRGVIQGLVPVIGLANPPQGTSDDPLSPPPYMRKELADAILLLAPSVPSDTTMIYDSNYGLGWEDSRGWQVFFGTVMRDMALKLRVYESLALSLSERGLYPVFINVSYPEAPYYRMSAEFETKSSTQDNGQ